MPQTDTNEPPKDKDKNATAPDPLVIKTNARIMKIFSNLISGREQTEAVPPIFVKAASLITNRDFTNEEKMLLVYGMAHSNGRSFCLYFLNKSGSKLFIFPHLFLQAQMHKFPVLRHCPNLLRMSVAKRIQLLDKLPERVKICQRCSNPYENKCKPCNRIPYIHMCKK